MKNIVLALVVAALVPLLAACPGGDVTPGGACDQEGVKHTNANGYSYTCHQLQGGNRIWRQDQPLTPDRP